jgi:nucleoside-diphosphate kinase
MVAILHERGEEKMIEQTLVLVKPDGVQRGLVGEILQRFEKVGLKIVGMKMIWVDADFAKKHYKAHVDKPFYPGLEAMITEGPVIAMALEGIHAVELVRKIVGPTEPRSAQPGTIRGDYAHVSYEYADKEKKAIKNLIHASGNKEEAKAEIKLWFKKEELHSYPTVHEKHTR